MKLSESGRALIFIFAPPVTVAVLLGWLSQRFRLLTLGAGSTWFIVIWLLGLALLLTEFLYIASFVVVATLKGQFVLPEGPVDETARTAVVYVVKNETGRLGKNIRASLDGNQGPGIDFWLLSDQTDVFRCLELEKQICKSLQGRLRYYHRDQGEGWKRGMISEWLGTAEGLQYQFIVVCDADSVLPQGTVNALLSKAAARENAQVAVFQSLIAASRPPWTYFAKWLQPGQELTERVYVRASQHIFGRSMFFGSGALIRAECYRDIKVPMNALSHDIWDTALLEVQGWKTAFCEDIVTYEQYPCNYLEAFRREQRWLLGTLQALRLVGYIGLSLGTRFQILRAAYLYLLQPFFLLWIFLGLVGDTPVDGRLVQVVSIGPLLYIPWFLGLYGGGLGSPVGVSLIWVGLCLLIVWAHRLPARGGSNWVFRLSEIFWSTLLYMNNLVYVSAAVLMAPFVALFRPPGAYWQPAAKEYTPVRLSEAIIAMMPSTLLGLFGLWVGWQSNLRWMLAALPVLLSLVLSIPLVYLTARESLD